MWGSSRLPGACILAVVSGLCAPRAPADVVTDWYQAAADLVVEAKLAAPSENRILAIVQTAVLKAVEEVGETAERAGTRPGAVAGGSVEAAVAAASRTVLARLVPSRKASVDAAFEAAIAKVADGPAKLAGLSAGERAAETVLSARLDDGASEPEAYRPLATPGLYVPTTIPAVPQWPKRQPWLMASPSQFRCGPPPELSSAAWARAFEEVRTLGGRDSPGRSTFQTEVARFWEATVPQIYQGVVLSVAGQPGRNVLRNARLAAAVTQAIDDALIAVFDAKYHYAFWRPVTAIRNGDLDGNDATPRDPSWRPFIETPMHPEYPCAHCVVAGAVAAVLAAEVGDGPVPRLSTKSPTAGGVEHGWATFAAFEDEVANGRVWGGVHHRFSTEAGREMGHRVGALAAERFLQRLR